ncbi:LiaI-LiaF-like domain-containing protein [Gracilibacillus xinjiangensis]|uniref:LiaI-LiaF-like domain-containing protein n=1 Tax=Gracilibacillus xinjiangensis TaxID=1193282 RepID=A0ABV8WW41_9BACI
MKKNSLLAYLLIGIGLYFLLRELRIPILTDFYSWPTLLILIGSAFLVHAFSGNEEKSIFPGVVLLGLGIHFHGLNHYPFWIAHWGIYTLIVSIAFLLRFVKTKHGIIPGVVLFVISIFAMFVDNQPSWFVWIHDLMGWMERFWPIVLIGLGIYLLLKRK